MNTLLQPLPARLLLMAFGAGCLLHVDRAPLWCIAVAAATLLARWLHIQGRLALPGRGPRIAITLVLALAVWFSFRTLNGLAAGSALLIVMGAAKLLETRTLSDAVVVAIVALVLVLAAALDRQGLARLPLYVGTGWLALASIAALGSMRAAVSARSAFLTAGSTALYAVPFAALCFVLMPRLPGALWAMPGGAGATTGLSDEMSPGNISELSISEEIAFRVRFDGPPPPPQQRYWRGPVLHDFDGYTWRRGIDQPMRTRRDEMLSPPLRYHVMLEPHGRNYLFPLDMPASIDGVGMRFLADGQALAWRQITAPLAYDAVSHLQWRSSGELTGYIRGLDTRLPPGRNARSVALARELRGTVDTDAQFAARVLEYFGAGGFEYSLTPPLLDYDSIDDLLFRTKLGFCGHFASAYVTLMRAAGVPARVVTGYQGGAWNALGGYYTVRQSDAHAWAEVWLEGSGWTRFDPTGVVAPQRLQRGATDAPEASRGNAAALFGEARWLRGLRDAWEAAGGWWQEQVVGFNRAKQRDLLEKLGLGRLDYGALALLLTAGGALWALLLLALLARRTAPPRRDPLARLWDGFLALLGRHGIAVADHDGPDAIRRRAQRELPQAAGDIDVFAAEYARLRYGGGEADAPAIAAMKGRLSAIARATTAARRRRTAPAAPG